jgi:hypothetical protein
MKILGHGTRDSLIVEMTRDELAHITGVDSAYDLHGRPGDQTPVGSVFHPSEIYRRLKHQAQVADRLKGAADSLESLADLVRHVAPIASELTKSPDENKEAKV